ncbi:MULTISPECIES: hypothetical protein [Corynebacterium]|uniref:hypothetical protein n=1 Tax=Corynebacterium TaxID=1716 RepID=UPI001EF41A77|nr:MULTISPECIES: hypothetical protein [Corynebacterium]MDN8623907.1 hypothetical protein [Corynebacterium kroppenstedtii]
MSSNRLGPDQSSPSEFDPPYDGSVGQSGYGNQPDNAPTENFGLGESTQQSGVNHRVNWPTVMMAGGVAAIVAAVILAIGVVGLSRHGDDNSATYVAEESTDAQGHKVLKKSPVPSSAKKSKHATGKNGHDKNGTSKGATGGGALGAPTEGKKASSGGNSDSRSGSGLNGNGRESGSDSSQNGQDESNAGDDDADDSGVSDSDSGNRRWTPSSPLPANYTVTDPNPSLDELNGIVYFLTATDASDEAKKANIEAPDAVVVPKTVSRIGLFRAPRGGSRLTEPMERHGDTITVQLHSFSAGIPDISMPIDFVYKDGNWRLASSSMCQGVKTVGLPIYCNA